MNPAKQALKYWHMRGWSVWGIIHLFLLEAKIQQLLSGPETALSQFAQTHTHVSHLTMVNFMYVVWYKKPHHT